MTAHSGSFGAHALIDELVLPGVTCQYGDAPNTVRTIRVRPPAVFARAGRTSQTVGWRVRVEQFDGSWTEPYRSGFRKATSTPKRAAAFSARSVDAASFVSAAAIYRAVVDLRWYASDGSTVRGTASHPVALYRWTNLPTGDSVEPDCGGVHG